MQYLDIYKLLEKTNCGNCQSRTCMAFALAVAKGERDIGDCPHMDKDIAEEIRSGLEKRDWKGELIESLRKEVASLPLASVARGLGGEMSEGRLNIQCLGMPFSIDNEGRITTEGHINPWIEILLLHYVRTSGSVPVSEEWIAFGELKGGMVKDQSFRRECENPLRELIDTHGEHIFDMLSLFGGRKIDHEATPHAWIIYPLPKVPFLILYWEAEEDFGSDLKVLLDRSADQYLDVESIIFLGEGLVEMFRKILSRHG